MLNGSSREPGWMDPGVPVPLPSSFAVFPSESWRLLVWGWTQGHWVTTQCFSALALYFSIFGRLPFKAYESEAENKKACSQEENVWELLDWRVRCEEMLYSGPWLTLHLSEMYTPCLPLVTAFWNHSYTRVSQPSLSTLGSRQFFGELSWAAQDV